MLLYLPLVYGCFHATTAELSSRNRDCLLTSLKLLGSLPKKFASPLANLPSCSTPKSKGDNMGHEDMPLQKFGPRGQLYFWSIPEALAGQERVKD